MIYDLQFMIEVATNARTVSEFIIDKFSKELLVEAIEFPKIRNATGTAAINPKS